MCIILYALLFFEQLTPINCKFSRIIKRVLSPSQFRVLSLKHVYTHLGRKAPPQTLLFAAQYPSILLCHSSLLKILLQETLEQIPYKRPTALSFQQNTVRSVI